MQVVSIPTYPLSSALESGRFSSAADSDGLSYRPEFFPRFSESLSLTFFPFKMRMGRPFL